MLSLSLSLSLALFLSLSLSLSVSLTHLAPQAASGEQLFKTRISARSVARRQTPAHPKKEHLRATRCAITRAAKVGQGADLLNPKDRSRGKPRQLL